MEEPWPPVKRRTGLVVAIDLTDLDEALSVAKAAGPHADALKVGYPTALSAGLSSVGALQRASGRPVICDFKIADIPPIAESIARLAVGAGAAGVICHAFAGTDSMQAVAAVCRQAGALPIAVVEMSHEGGREFTQPAAEELLEAALRAGAQAIVAPATRPERILRVRRGHPGVLIFAPGAGAQGGSPLEAARAGADFVIVGRSIVGAHDPGAAAADVAAQIAKARPPGP